MKTIQELEKEAKESFLDKQKELPDVITDDNWPWYYNGWLEMSYKALLTKLKNTQKRLEQYENKS
jgi:hypothetical protein